MAEPLDSLRQRLDRLGAEEPQAPKLSDRAAKLVGNAEAPQTPELLALDAALDRAGVFTLADAKLLASLMKGDARSAEVGKGIRRRVAKAADELERLLSFEERRKRLEQRGSVTAVERLEDLFGRLVRAVKVADLLDKPEANRPDLYAVLPRGKRSEVRVPSDARVAAAEFLVRRAQASTLDVKQKRRDLDSAHELLLRIGSEADRERVRQLRAEVAEARSIPKSGLVSDRSAALRSSVLAGDGARAWSTALDLYKDAVRAEDDALAGAARLVLDQLSPRSGGLQGAVEQGRARDFLGTVGEGGAVARFVDRAYGGNAHGSRDRLTELALDLDSDRWATFDLAIGAGRFFDVEEAGSEPDDDDDPQPTFIPELRRVPYPTPHMDLGVASGLNELPNFIIQDPRTLLYDVASGRQLARTFYEADVPRDQPQRTKKGAVRVYVCDASSSMKGERARFRDAVLIAELNNLSVREARGQRRQPIYFSFFSDFATDVQRVDNADAALRVVASLFQSSPAQGRTDITWALEAAFFAIREARGNDPDLGRATVVLITDGEDRVDLERIRAARTPVGDVEITLSFISLGGENRDLRQLVFEQRSRGRRAFYYALTDAELKGLRSDFDCGLRTLLPAQADIDVDPDDPKLREAVEALVAVAAEKSASTKRAPPETRFEAYFPKKREVAGGPSVPGDVERLGDLLNAVVDAVSLAPAEVRTAEAVELLEHLLGRYNVKVTAYLQTLPHLDPRGVDALERLRLLAAPLSTEGGAAWASSTG